MKEPLRIQRQLGKSIRSFRLAAEISQEKLAERSGLHRTYISSVERGKRNPTLRSIHAIAKALKIPVSRLLDEVS